MSMARTLRFLSLTGAKYAPPMRVRNAWLSSAVVERLETDPLRGVVVLGSTGTVLRVGDPLPPAGEDGCVVLFVAKTAQRPILAINAALGFLSTGQWRTTTPVECSAIQNVLIGGLPVCVALRPLRLVAKYDATASFLQSLSLAPDEDTTRLLDIMTLIAQRSHPRKHVQRYSHKESFYGLPCIRLPIKRTCTCARLAVGQMMEVVVHIGGVWSSNTTCGVRVSVARVKVIKDR